MNNITKTEALNSVALSDGFEETATEANERLIKGRLLTFSEGTWTAGQEKEEIVHNTELIALATAAAWVIRAAGHRLWPR
jgi:hypothetical protein